MSETRIRRGGTSRLSPARSKSDLRPRGRAGVKHAGPIDRFVAALPVSERTVQRAVTWTIGAALLAGTWGVASFFGLPDMARSEAALVAGRAGFEVRKVQVRGTSRMDEMDVYAIALDQVDRSMLSVDLPALRTQMLALSWVKDARISRRLPDTLVVDIVEREPVAVWQNGGKLALIDVSGAVLEPVRAGGLPDLPLVVGPNANRQTARLTALMDAAPSLRPVLAGASWIGNRRWDLRFQSGETLSLPEGEEEAAAALVSFARMDGVNRLLGRGIVRFDMRDPDKFVLRLPHDRGGKEGAGEGTSGDKPAHDDGATARTAPDDHAARDV